MKRLRIASGVIALAVLALSAGRGSAQTVQTFEDYTPCDLDYVGMYGSVNYADQWTCYSFSQSPYNAHSGTNRVFSDYNNFAAAFYFTGGPVTFDGAWFAGNDYASVTFELLLSGAPVWTSETLFTSAAPTFLSSGYSGMIDQVRVVSERPQYWVMDDVTFNSGTSVVPEPASIALLATGLVGVLAARRRFRST